MNASSNIEIQSCQTILVNFENRQFGQISNGIGQKINRILAQMQICQIS